MKSAFPWQWHLKMVTKLMMEKFCSHMSGNFIESCPNRVRWLLRVTLSTHTTVAHYFVYLSPSPPLSLSLSPSLLSPFSSFVFVVTWSVWWGIATPQTLLKKMSITISLVRLWWNRFERQEKKAQPYKPFRCISLSIVITFYKIEPWIASFSFFL